MASYAPQHLGITTTDGFGDSWQSWLMTQAMRRGFADLDALSVACDLPVERLLNWRATSGGDRPVIADLMRVAALLQVDPYDLLVAAGWVDPTVS